jgi:hypothetical protein
MAGSLISKERVEIFFSYSHRDEELRIELRKHLAPLKRQHPVIDWHDRIISPGKEWKGEINTHLEKAQIVLLLISPDFIDSDYCYDVEMKRALERHKEGKSRVIPVILRPVSWENAPFGKLQVLPRDGYPVTSWNNRDEALRNVAEGLKRVVEELLSKETDSKVSGLRSVSTHPKTIKRRSKKDAPKRSKATSSAGIASIDEAIGYHGLLQDLFSRDHVRPSHCNSAIEHVHKARQCLLKSLELPVVTIDHVESPGETPFLVLDLQHKTDELIDNIEQATKTLWGLSDGAGSRATNYKRVIQNDLDELGRVLQEMRKHLLDLIR